MSMLHIPIVHAHDISKQIPQENSLENSMENMYTDVIY